MTTEYATQPEQTTVWLIEAAWGPSQPAYLSVTRAGGRFFEWSFSPERALKFADRQTCDDVIDAVREKSPELFPSIVPMPRPTEHIFINGTGFPKPTYDPRLGPPNPPKGPKPTEFA